MSDEFIESLARKAKWLRHQVLDMAAVAGEGHVVSVFSCAEILIALYYGGILRFNPKEPKWEGRDRFILSKGQGGLGLYPILSDLGFFPKEELLRFCQKGSILGIHAEPSATGVEAVTGSLGHGLGLAIGLAIAAKMDRKLWMTVALLGDGECYEGQIWESAMFAAHHQLNNLVAIVDRNYLCVTDFTENLVRLAPLDKKWEAFGWDVTVIDGHSFHELLDALRNFRNRGSNKPLVIIANTIKGKGVSFLENEPLWHGAAVEGELLQQAHRQIES